MGSICRNNKKEHWEIKREGVFKNNQLPAVEVITGNWDDYGSGGYLSVYMQKAIYEKIMNETYSWKSTPYDEIPIKVLNADGNEIDLISGLLTTLHNLKVGEFDVT